MSTARLKIITITTAVYVSADKWDELRHDIVDEGMRAEPDVGIMQDVPPETSADVQLDMLRGALSDAATECMLDELEASAVVGYPQVQSYDPDNVRILDDECAF